MFARVRSLPGVALPRPVGTAQLSPVPDLPDPVLVGVGVLALYFGATFLVRSAGAIAVGAGVRPGTVGVTVVAFATSAPELVTSVVGGLAVSGELGLGNVIGSNVANVGLVLGLTALVDPPPVARDALRLHVPAMLVATAALVTLGLDGRLGPFDGGVLLALLVGFTYLLVRRERGRSGTARRRAPGSEAGREPHSDGDGEPRVDADVDDQVPPPASVPDPDGVRRGDVVRLVAGVAVLLLGSTWLVDGSVGLLRALGVSDLVIGLTAVALGTSLPELAAGLVSAARGESAIGVGNVVGSNIYNVLAVGGLLAVVAPVAVRPETIAVEFPALVGFTVAAAAAMALRRDVARWEGVLLLAAYVAFLYFAVTGS